MYSSNRVYFDWYIYPALEKCFIFVSMPSFHKYQEVNKSYGFFFFFWPDIYSSYSEIEHLPGNTEFIPSIYM